MLWYIWGLIRNNHAKLTGAKLTALLLPLSQILSDRRAAFLMHVVWQLETVASLSLASNDIHQSFCFLRGVTSILASVATILCNAELSHLESNTP